MPEQTQDKLIASTWSAAHAAAAAALKGVGGNEEPAKRGAHRERSENAARKSFAGAGVAFKRVTCRIAWGGDKPKIELELITIDGHRFVGPTVEPPRKDTPPSAPAKLESKPADK